MQAEIAGACERSGRSPDSVTLIAVSKTHAAAQVVQATEAGLQHFGENRVEEALPKIERVRQLTAAPVHWHMVGHVQSRKARYVAGEFALVHSIDSLKLAERLGRYAAERRTIQDVLLEINVSGEATKAGWDAYNWQNNASLRGALWSEIAAVLAQPGLAVRGLMTMAPIVAEMEQARTVFAGLRTLRDALANDFPVAEWSALSMGMTDDYPVAVEEGATMVRIGRAIFGPRPA